MKVDKTPLEYRQARAILAIAVLRASAVHPPNYQQIAKLLDLPKKAADLADEIWNSANAPDESTIKSEERALERAQDLLEAALDL